jgi:hypothetical protein
LRYRDDDYDYDKPTMECEMPDWQATRDQAQFQVGKDGIDSGLAAALEAYDLTLDDKRKAVARGPLTETALREAVSKDGCYFVAFNGKDSDGKTIGHALAVEKVGAHYALFDANHGHFSVTGAQEFAFFVGHYLQKTKYKTRYAEACGIFPVKTPGADIGIELRPELPA